MEELDDLSNGLSQEEQFLVDTRGLEAWFFIDKELPISVSQPAPEAQPPNSTVVNMESVSESPSTLNNSSAIEPASEISTESTQEPENFTISERTDIFFYPNSHSISEDKPNPTLTAFTNLPMLKTKEFNYFEVKFVNLPVGTSVHVGFSSKPFTYNRPPGLHAKDNSLSVGYCSKDGRKFYAGKGLPYGASLSQGDVLGVGVAHDAGIVFFTKNGVRFEDAFIGLPRMVYYPCISSNGPAQVNVNIGQATYLWIEANFREMAFVSARDATEAPPAYHQAIMPDQPPPVLATPFSAVPPAVTLSRVISIPENEPETQDLTDQEITQTGSRLSVQTGRPVSMVGPRSSCYIAPTETEENSNRWSVLSYADVMHPPPAYHPSEGADRAQNIR
jgi:hypothetical protein